MNQQNIGIIPLPARISLSNGCFQLDNKTNIVVSDKSNAIYDLAKYLKAQILSMSRMELDLAYDIKGKSNILLTLSDTSDTMNKEGYKLTVEKNKIEISVSDEAGLFYGIQSLIQLLTGINSKEKTIRISEIEINDWPRYRWRGMHLDVCRHFFSVEFIKKYIDLLAMHKMNILHWHLTEDQGWRTEIKQYPKLTEIGAWRKEKDGSRYGGFYTQDEIREIIEYASQRYITVVPEIELPGHALAALSAYPEYSCTGGPFEVTPEWGVFKDVYCAGKEETYEFLENILCEVIELFPGQYIHIGGDECPKARWKECPHCQKRITDEGLKDEFELQSYFIGRIGRFLESKNKRMIGWDEILEGGLPENAIVMSWRSMDGGVEAAQAGHDVIMSPISHCYFDFYQAKENEPKAIGGYLPLEKVYEFDPTPDTLSNNQEKNILGGQGNVWTEYMPTESHVEYMAVPRICALAETLWSPKAELNYNDFLRRLSVHFSRLDRLNINYRRY